MKRLLIALFGLLVASVSAQVIPVTGTLAAAPTSSIIGQLQTATGGPITNGTLTFVISQPAVVSGSSSVVGSATSCFTSTAGAVVGIPDPSTAPIVSTQIGTGNLTAGTYYVQITYVTNGSESLPSPAAIVSLPSQGSLIVSPPTAFQSYPATGFRVYASQSPTTEVLQATSSGFAAPVTILTLLSSGQVPPTVNGSVCNIYFSDQLVPTGTYYTVSLTNKNGSNVSGYPQTWCTYGGAGGTINVSNGAPTGNCNVNGVFYPTPIMAAPQNSATQSIAGNLSIVGNLSANSIGNIVYADRQPGGDCGAKINYADAQVLGPLAGTIYVNNACGMTITTPVVLSPYHALVFISGGTWAQQGSITLGIGTSLQGLPSALNEDIGTTPGNNNNPAVVLQQPPGTNLTNMVVLKGSNIALLDIAIDGNARGGGNTATTCVTTDTSSTVTGSRGRIYFNFLTVENCGLDNIDILSTLANNQAIAFRMENSSSNHALGSALGAGGFGLLVSHSTDAHIFASQFELNSACGLESLDSVTFASFSDFSTNARCQALFTVDGDTALAPFLDGGASLIQNGFTTTALASGTNENAFSSVIINGYNGSACNVLTNTYIALNTFAIVGGLQDNAISAIRLTDTGSATILGNKIESSGSSASRYKYAVSIGNVGAGCTQEYADIVSNNGYFGNYGTAAVNYASSTDPECNVTGVSPGCQRARVASCTTAGSGNAACPTTITWGVPFANANYTAWCTLDNPNFPAFVTFTSSKLAASLVVNIQNAPGSSSAASGTLNCEGKTDN